MAEIETSVLRIGSNDLVLQDGAARGSLANAYSASSTYAVGDYVLYGGQLYECNTAISTAEAWTAAHWTAVTVSEKLADISGEVSTVKDGLSDMDDRVTALEEGGTGSGLTEDIKQALLQIAEKVAYIDEDGQDYYDALYDALYPPADLVSISAVYTQSGAVYETDTLDSLKTDLVVTAHMTDHTTRTVTEYTLSGTLAEGTSTVTVTYGGKTTMFNVTVLSDTPIYPLEDGTHTYTNGRTLTTTSAGHVEYTNTSSSSTGTGWFGNLSDIDANDNTGTSTSVYGSTQWFHVSIGDVIRMEVSNIVVVQNPVATNKNWSINLREHDLCNYDYANGDTEKTITSVVAEDTYANCLGTYARNSWQSISFDVKIYVNDVRYV